MKWGWTNRNVVRLATPPAVSRQSRTTPTPTVVTELLREAAESRNPENHVAFRLLAATGARRGEICGLRWSSVDLDRRVLWIRHSVARLKTGKLIEKDPKITRPARSQSTRAPPRSSATTANDRKSSPP